MVIKVIPRLGDFTGKQRPDPQLLDIKMLPRDQFTRESENTIIYKR